MSELTFEEMQQMQRVLQEKYKDKWGGLPPAAAVSKMLWLHGELGEASDIIKKKGHESILTEGEVRDSFIEEMCDVLMYYNDVLLCFGITADELEKIYREKFERNMKRW